MKRFAAMLLSFLLLTGCAGQKQKIDTEPVSTTVFAMDTVMDMTVYGGAEALLKQAQDCILDLEARLSVTDSNSEIHTLNQEKTAILSPDTQALLEQALALCRETGGALDISIYPVLREWGFTTGSYQIPEEVTLETILQSVDYSQITLEEGRCTLQPGMEVDLGSVAKGYTGDRLCALLREAGVESAILNLGGNVQVIGSKPDGTAWRVAVQDPESSGYLGVLELRDRAAITSGGYERYFEDADGQRYWHILDPDTGVPARSGLFSVTVVGECGVMCDALSTALFVMGLEDAAEYWRQTGGFDAVFVSQKGDIWVTAGLESSFALTEEYLDRMVTVIEP